MRSRVAAAKLSCELVSDWHGKNMRVCDRLLHGIASRAACLSDKRQKPCVSGASRMDEREGQTRTDSLARAGEGCAREKSEGSRRVYFSDTNTHTSKHQHKHSLTR